MATKKFIEKGIHYIRKTYPNGSIVKFPDPEFQDKMPEPVNPPLPDLSTINKKLDFIISELHLKHRFSKNLDNK